MSERELQRIAIRAENLQHENSTYGQVHDLREEIDTVCLDSQRLLSEVRRSHTEAAELRERVEILQGALQRMVYRIEQFLDEMEKHSIRMPMWNVMTVQEALRLAHVALAKAKLETRSEEEG